MAQTVWNVLHGFDAAAGIKDYDVPYFDGRDLSSEAEAENERRVADACDGSGVKVDVKNQARVHLWYEARFGRAIEPYRSTEDAIATWPTTATSVGVRRDGSGLAVWAPFGLGDLFAMVVRPNRALVTRAVYEEKASRWQARWPRLTVIPWDS